MFIIKQYSNAATTKNSPSALPRLPLVGNLHQLGLFLHRTLQTLAKKYGPLMLLHFGEVAVLVVSSADAARELMKTHDLVFSDRPHLKMNDVLMYGSKDLACSMHVRRILEASTEFECVTPSQHQNGSILSRFERRKQCCSDLLHVNLTDMFAALTNDVTCRVALGRRYWTMYLGLYERAQRVAKHLDQFIEEVIQEHVRNRRDGDVDVDSEEQSDFVDVFLSIEKSNTTGSLINRNAIKGLMLDMFVAGSDITTAMDWTMSEVLKHPTVMHKLQEEVRSVVGNRTQVTEDDLGQMNYLKAVIKESLRLHPSIPLMVPRKCMEDIKVKDYDIAVGTVVLVNAWAIARDPSPWDQPLLFKPERFLRSSIDFKGHDFELIPFGARRRGEDLDMSETAGLAASRISPLLAVATAYERN
ncbi:Cytochrome P450 71A6 [Glycine soja]|uniref:Cytochrome P450 71A6 n=1 Tax=Glycine soja TaxID=3848 RepID=A0A445JYV9_GLYSO|nr:Cytochrome P450 71A6 [Glycine soja]